MWSVALDSSGVLQSYSITSLAQHIAKILTSALFKTHKNSHLHAVREDLAYAYPQLNKLPAQLDTAMSTASELTTQVKALLQVSLIIILRFKGILLYTVSCGVLQ